MPDETLGAMASGTITPERRDEPTVVVEEDIEIWEEAAPAERHPMVKAAAIALLAVAISIGIGLLISEVGDTGSAAGDGDVVPEDCRPIPFSVSPRPC